MGSWGELIRGAVGWGMRVWVWVWVRGGFGLFWGSEGGGAVEEEEEKEEEGVGGDI